MKNRIIFPLLISLSALSATAQVKSPFRNLNELWAEYRVRSQVELGTLTHNHFPDTVSVEEMKAAFLKFKDTPPTDASVFAGFDSVMYGPLGESILLKPALRDIPATKGKNLRGVWAWFGRFRLAQMLDEEGKPQEKPLEKLKADEKEWMDGEFVALCCPHRYMGFIVSPFPYMNVYSQGKLLSRTGLHNGHADFFSFAQRFTQVLDGRWDDFVNAGARYMGQLLSIDATPDTRRPETTFSVLLYPQGRPKPTSVDMMQPPKTPGMTAVRSEKRKEASKKVAPYTLELLAPAEPDEHTQHYFEQMKRFVESLPRNAFKPYYTADSRLLPGRFYRVTVNKCGWLVEDYF